MRFRAIRRGFTLIETAIVMIIAIGALAAGASIYSDYLRNLTNSAAAAQIREVSAAFLKFTQDRHVQLLLGVQAQGGQMTVPISDLVGDYLPQDFQNLTPFNYEFVLALRKPSAVSDVLEALVVTEPTSLAFALPAGEASDVARLVGSSGGYLSEVDPLAVRSSFGGYEIDVSDFGINPGAGSIVSFVSADAVVGDMFLHRGATGDPEHNRMNVSLDMNSNDVTNIDTASARRMDVDEMLTVGAGGIATSGPLVAQSVATNSLVVDADLYAGTLRSGHYAPPGGGCSAGSVGYYDADTMSCSGGVWKKSSGDAQYLFGGTYYIAYGCASVNPFTGSCSCPVGYSAQLIYNVNGEGGRDLYICFKAA